MDKEIIEACKSSRSMGEAASKVGLHFNTFKRRAIKLGVYNPNQGLKGEKVYSRGNTRFLLKDILEGKHPQYQTNKLRIRLLKEGYKEHRCEHCNSEWWNEQPIPLELNHIDGDRTNHRLDNLEMICPNCHAQTSTYRAKNIKNKSL